MQICILIFIYFYELILMQKVSNRQPQCLDTVVYSQFLMQESRNVFVVFTEIIFSHGDVFDSNIKIFW